MKLSQSDIKSRKQLLRAAQQKQLVEDGMLAIAEQKKKGSRAKTIKAVWFAFLILFGAPVGFILLSLLWKGITGR